MTRKSSTETLIAAMRILARDIQSGDGVANAAITEAADRLEEQHTHIAELDGRINILLEQRNRLGQDVQNAAITGVVPENHAIGAQLGLVANMRAKLADLARKAAHDVTLTNEGNITDHLRDATKMAELTARIAELEAKAAIGWRAVAELEAKAAVGRRAVEMLREIAAEADDPLCHIGQRVSAILRDAEQAESSNNRVILGSSDHVPGATKMVTDRLRARIAELEAQAAKEPSTVAVDAGALEALRSAMSKLRAPMSRTEYAAARAGIIEAAYRLLAGGVE